MEILEEYMCYCTCIVLNLQETIPVDFRFVIV